MAPVAAGFDDLAELGRHDLAFSFPVISTAPYAPTGEITGVKQVAAPADAAARAPITTVDGKNPLDGADMVFIPAGDFLIGTGSTAAPMSAATQGVPGRLLDLPHGSDGGTIS